MLPIDASAYGSCSAAALDANVSGSDVPSATSVIAVSGVEMPSRQPTWWATSPMTAVSAPIPPSDMKKAGQPPQIDAGGTSANA
eukprot:2843160-Prymnesium_polylepis.1